MGMSEKREIRVGDRTLTIQEPNGFKFLEATELIGQISEQVPELERLNNEFILRHKQTHEIILDKPVAIIRYPEAFEGLDAAWWTARGDRIVIPADPPSDIQQGLVMFKHVFKAAREPVLRMVAVLGSPSGELAAADENGNLEQYLKDFQKWLLHNGRVTDLALILIKSLEAMRDEFAADSEANNALGEIQGFFRGRATTVETGTTTAPSSSPETKPEPEPAPAPPAPPARVLAEGRTGDGSSPKPASSTSSPPATGGADETLSTGPHGPSSASSAASSPASA